MHRTPILLIATITLLAGPALTVDAAAESGDTRGFGVAPTDLDFGALLRGEPAVRQFGIQNSGNAPLNVSITTGGPMGPWTSLPTTNLTIAPRTTHVVDVTITPPADAPNGAYNGTVTPTRDAEPAAEDEEGVRIALSIPVHLTARVTGTEVLGLDAEGLWVPTIETGHTLPVSMWLTNTGNVRVSPTAEVRVFSATGADVLGESTLPFGVVIPGETRNATASATFPLPPGQYRVAVTTLLRGEAVATEEALFDVLDEGELGRRGILDGIHTLDAQTRVLNHRLTAGRAFVVNAPFENVGEADVTASLQGYVTRDGSVVKEFDTAPVAVARGEHVNLTLLVTDIVEPGTYTIVGRVHYSGKVTPEFSAIVNLLVDEDLDPHLGGDGAGSQTGGSIPVIHPAALVLGGAGAAAALSARARRGA